MSNTKYRLELFSLYDGTGVARHLEKMAAGGWMLERIGRTFWQYKAIEPKKLHFSTTFLPRASSFDPDNSEERGTFYDFCERTGWTFVADWERMQIFCNEQADPVPLDTDPETQLRIIHRAMRTTNITLAVLGLISLFFAYGFVGSLIVSPVRILANAIGAFSGYCFLLLLILCCAELISYFLWRRKAKQAAQRGDFFPTRGVRHISAICLILLVPAVIFYLSSARSAFHGTFMIGYFFIIFLGVCLGEMMKRHLKKRGTSPGGNRTATALTAGTTSVILIMVALPFLINAARGNPDPSIILLNDPPVDLLTLQGNRDGELYRSIDYDHSVLFTQYSMTLRAQGQTLQFIVTKSNLPFLSNWCKEQLLDKYSPWRMKDLEGEYRKTEVKNQGVPEVWQFYENDAATNRFLLCYEDHCVEIVPDWTLTAAQMTAIGEAMATA